MQKKNFSFMAIIFFGALMAATGCSLMGGSGGVVWNEYLEEHSEVPPYQECGSPSVDAVGKDVNDLARATYDKARAFVKKSDNNATWAAYSNDVAKCREAAGEGENTCDVDVLSAANQEQQKAIEEFRKANNEQVGSMVRELLAVADLTLQVKEAVEEPEMGSASIVTLGKSVKKAQEDLSLLVQMQQFYNTQKGIMDAMETHQGR